MRFRRVVQTAASLTVLRISRDGPDENAHGARPVGTNLDWAHLVFQLKGPFPFRDDDLATVCERLLFGDPAVAAGQETGPKRTFGLL